MRVAVTDWLMFLQLLEGLVGVMQIRGGRVLRGNGREYALTWEVRGRGEGRLELCGAATSCSVL